jgi:exosortase/archaeosortase family protein
MAKIYVLHENEAWVITLRDAFAARSLPFEEWHLAEGHFDLDEPPPQAVFYNRMSASSHTRDHRFAPEYTASILAWLEGSGRRVVNGEQIVLAEACSGMRLVFSLTLVVFAFAFSVPLRAGTRLLLMAIIALIALAAKVVRLVPTSLLYGQVSVEYASTFHDVSGWAMLPLALLALVALLRLLRWLEEVAERVGERLRMGQVAACPVPGICCVRALGVVGPRAARCGS